MTSQANSSVCFYPDGVTNGSNYSPLFVPCDPSAKHSACCAIGESCTDNGLCYSDNGGVYRGACTDKSWTSSACASVCIDSDNQKNLGSQTAWTFLQGCGASLSTPTWTCGLNECNDSQLTFPLKIGAIQQFNITGTLETKSTASSASSTVTASSNPSCASSPSLSSTQESNTCSTSNVVAVGAGVGVPLGILALSFFCWALMEMRKRKALEKGYNQSNWNGHKYERAMEPVELATDTKVAEMPAEHARRESEDKIGSPTIRYS